MAYRMETIKSMIEKMAELTRKYRTLPVSEIKLCISNGNVKIGRVMNVSLPPVLSCPNCSECMKIC